MRVEKCVLICFLQFSYTGAAFCIQGVYKYLKFFLFCFFQFLEFLTALIIVKHFCLLKILFKLYCTVESFVELWMRRGDGECDWLLWFDMERPVCFGRLWSVDLCSCFALAELSFEETVADKILWDCHVLKSCVSSVLDGAEHDTSTTGSGRSTCLCVSVFIVVVAVFCGFFFFSSNSMQTDLKWKFEGTLLSVFPYIRHELRKRNSDYKTKVV